MNDKKFVHIIVWMVLFVTISITLLIRFMPENRYMDGEYPYWKQQKDYSLTDGDKQEVLLLGDSRMKMGVLATELSEDAYNLALGGGTPLEMYYSVKRYLQHHQKPKAVIVAFGATHFTEMSCYVTRNMYFHYFDENESEEANARILELDGKDYRSENVAYQYKMPTIYLRAVVKSILRPRTEYNSDLYLRVANSKGRMFGHDNKTLSEVVPQECRSEHFMPLNSLTYYMEKLVKLCLDNDIPIYIEQLPMGNPGYQMLVDSGYMSEYQKFIRMFRDKYGIIVNDEIPLYEENLFQDGSHLNLAGAQKLTAEWRKKYYSLLN